MRDGRYEQRTHAYPGVALLGVLLFGLLVAISPRSATAAPPPAPKPRLLVIGDSIILGTGDRIAQHLPDWDVTFDAAESRSTADGLDVLRSHGSDFTTVVVELGANDGGTPSVFTPRVRALLAALHPVPHVIWLTIPEARPYYRQANAIIRAEVAGRANARVADWSDAIGPGDVVGDGLHLTLQGYDDMAAWVARQVEHTVRPPATSAAPSTTPTTVGRTTVVTTTTGSTTSVASDSAQRSESGSGPWALWVLGGGVLILVAFGAVALTRRRRSGRSS